MTSQLLWFLLGCWGLALVVALIKLIFGVLAADARGAKPSGRLLLAAARTCVRAGVIFTTVVVLAALFKAIDQIWAFSDPTADEGSFKWIVLNVGFYICGVIAFGMLDRLLPNDPADATPALEARNDGRQNG
jgi:hypothetical protein